MTEKDSKVEILNGSSEHGIHGITDSMACDHSEEQKPGSSSVGILYLCATCNLLQFPSDAEIHGRWVKCQ